MSRFHEAARRHLREAALDVAADHVLAHGWPGLQMRAVATEVGVSRQTLYNTFTSKHGLAQALILRRLDEFLDGIEDAITACSGLHDQLAAAVRYTLDTAADDRLLKTVLTQEGSEEFLPLLTSEGDPVVVAARNRLVTVLTRAHPDLDRARCSSVSEAVTRLTVSHVLLPLHPSEQVADETARFAAHVLRPDGISGAGADAGGSPRTPG